VSDCSASVASHGYAKAGRVSYRPCWVLICQGIIAFVGGLRQRRASQVCSCAIRERSLKRIRYLSAPVVRAWTHRICRLKQV
jgi:hypothetical protein